MLYITTPIYYVNAEPHVGTFYTTVVADALMRAHRARFGNYGTVFLTGTDEHGQKIERIARERGVEPKAYCDGIVKQFKSTWKRAGVAYDRFIRTTDADHEAAVAEMWRRMEAAGDIYLGQHEGLYCVGCEDYKTDGDLLPAPDGGAWLCPVHLRPVEHVKEPNYFFRLSKYQQALLDLYDGNPDFVRPATRRNEVVEFVKGGLRDFSVSRTSVKWGIPVPGAPGHVVYVWIDALTNYVTALGGPFAVQAGGPEEEQWRSCVHLIAKDILRFHAVYWPAMLMSAGLPQPRGVLCHGYWTVKGQKMAKGIPATRVDPNAIGMEIGYDPLRYFVLREMPLGEDGDFGYEALLQRRESQLGNDLGNLLQRTVTMAHLFLGGDVPAASPDGELYAAAERARADAERHWDAFAPSRALEATWEMVRAANADIERVRPWDLAKDPVRHVEVPAALAAWCEILVRAALMVAPAMPERAAEMLRQLGRESDEGGWPSANPSWTGGRLRAAVPIFPKIDKAVQRDLVAKWTEAQGAQGAKT